MEVFFLYILVYVLQLLIGFEHGFVVLWDLKSKKADYRYSYDEVNLCLSFDCENIMIKCPVAEVLSVCAFDSLKSRIRLNRLHKADNK